MYFKDRKDYELKTRQVFSRLLLFFSAKKVKRGKKNQLQALVLCYTMLRDAVRELMVLHLLNQFLI